MTIQEWLKSTKHSRRTIADHCDVHESQVSRWADGATPQLAAFVKLVQLSGGKIAVEGLKVRKRGPRRSAA